MGQDRAFLIIEQLTYLHDHALMIIVIRGQGEKFSAEPTLNSGQAAVG